MDENETNPSQIDSDISNLVVDAGKKRKPQDDESELPLPKHLCLEQTSSSDPCSPLERFLGKSPETESGVVVGHSFSGVYEFAECSYATYNSKTGKTSSDESPHSASITGGLYMYKDSSCASGSSNLTTTEIKCYDLASPSIDSISFKDYDKTQAAEDVNQLEFLSSEFVIDGLEQLQDEEIPELLCSKDAGVASYRWSVSTQDTGEGTRKPTIDQEFEQYFSSLMMS